VERRKVDRRIDSRLRLIGLIIGTALAAGVISTSRIPAGAGSLGADVSVVAAPSGELAVKRSGVVLRGTGLTPGTEPAGGAVQLLNQTAGPVSVRLRGIPDTAALDRTLWVLVTGPSGEELYRGPLDGFRDWTAAAITLEPGEWRSIALEAWVPDDVGPGYAGRIAQIDLGFEVSTEREAGP
jgi:hypothetical protein